MEKAVLIFVGLLLLLTCTQFLAQSCVNVSGLYSSEMCNDAIKCVQGKCQCINGRHMALPLQRSCDHDACIALCKSKGEEIEIYNCAVDRCYCRKPLM